MIRRGDAKNGKGEDPRSKKGEIVELYLFLLFSFSYLRSVTSFFFLSVSMQISLYLTPFVRSRYDRNRKFLAKTR